MRERKVGCFDADLNPFPEDQCGFDSRPISVETCNSQPCNRAQSEPYVNCGCVLVLVFFCVVQPLYPSFLPAVPSIQNSGAGRSIIRFVPHVPGEQSGL